MGIGVRHPDTKLEVLSTNEQLKLSYDAANSATFEVKSTGDLNIKPTHTAITASSDLFVSGNAVFGRDCNDIITTVGQFTASCGISASLYIGSQVEMWDGVFANSVTVGSSTVLILLLQFRAQQQPLPIIMWVLSAQQHSPTLLLLGLLLNCRSPEK